jgi:hypothetical protein
MEMEEVMKDKNEDVTEKVELLKLEESAAIGCR